MSSLPDRTRPRLTRPGRDWMDTALGLASRMTWRALHPAVRGRYLEAPAPAPLPRFYYDTVDGWRAPLFYLPPRAGGSGEPVLVVHGLGTGGDVFRYGSGPTLSARLHAAGYAVYLMSHRGDRDAISPRDGARRAASFDELVERDLPAAAAVAVAHAGFPRLHLVGFGLGGQMGLVWASRRPQELASVVAVGAPVQFDRPASHLRLGARAMALLPAHWHLPLRTAARAAAPFVDAELEPTAHASPGGRLRGVLQLMSDDVPVGLLRQLTAWVEAGTLVSEGGVVDLVEALRDARVPLLAVAGSGDSLAAPAHVRPATERWGDPDSSLIEVPGYGHLDLLLGELADELVFGPLVDWLEPRRRLAWRPEGGAPEATTVARAAGAERR